jgi:hypothetical protein
MSLLSFMDQESIKGNLGKAAKSRTIAVERINFSWKRYQKALQSGV